MLQRCVHNQMLEVLWRSSSYLVLSVHIEFDFYESERGSVPIVDSQDVTLVSSNSCIVDYLV